MTLAEFASLWGTYKTFLESVTAVSSDALHIHASISIYLFVALFAGRGLASVKPWLFVLAIELANEWIDLHQPGGSAEANLAASQHDVLNTMLLPSLILIVARLVERRRPQDRNFLKR